MSDAVKVGFVPFSAAARGVLVALCDEALKFGPVTRKILGKAEGLVKRAAAAKLQTVQGLLPPLGNDRAFWERP